MAAVSSAKHMRVLIDVLNQQLEKTITQESKKDQLNTVKIEACRDFGVATANFHFSCEFQNFLDCPLEKTTAVVQQQFEELQAIQKMLGNDDRSMSDVLTRVQKFIKSLNFTDSQPLWTGLSTRYSYVINGRFSVPFLGLFRHAFSKPSRYDLTIDNCQVVKKENPAANEISLDVIAGE